MSSSTGNNNNNTDNNDNNASSNNNMSKTWKDIDYDKSIHLRDIFGSQYSFADDPTIAASRRTLVVKTASTKKKAAPPTIVEASPQKKEQQQQKLRQRIRRMQSHGSNTSSNNSTPQASPEPTAKPITTKPIVRRKMMKRSNSYIHRETTSKDEDDDDLLKLTVEVDHHQEQRNSMSMSMLPIPSDSLFLAAAANGEGNEMTVAEGHRVKEDDDYVYQTPDHSNQSGDVEEGSKVERSGMYSSNSKASIFKDEPSSSSGHKSASTTTAKEKLNNANNNIPYENPRRTFYMSGGLCCFFMILFILMQVLSIWIWDPRPPPLIMNNGPDEEILHQIVQETLGKLPPSTLYQMHHEPDSAPSMALQWFHADPHWQSYSVKRRQQRFVLAVLYFSTNPLYEHTWKHAGKWLNFDVSECDWTPNYNMCKSGSSNEDENVIRRLPLKHNNLTGSLPLEELALLTSLETLQLEDNRLAGTLPTNDEDDMRINWPVNLTRVGLQGNPGLTGQIPQSWCVMPYLTFDCRSSDADDGTTTTTTAGLCGCGCDC